MESRQKILVLATSNEGKTREIRSLLAGYPVIIKNLKDFGPLPEIEEDGRTFEENAYKKASLTARFLGLPCLADDSGLCVVALDGRPGVQSARWAGPEATDEQRCAKLLEELDQARDRRAAFECVISIAVPTGPALTYEGRCEGLITHEPRGRNGFGYDPVFFYPPTKKTFAEMTMEEKSKVSHRGRALEQIKEEFDKILIWIERHMPIFEKQGCLATPAHFSEKGE